MFSKSIQDLIDYFLKFPGVGPRQATRFVFYLLREEKDRVQELAAEIAKLHEAVRLCIQCYKSFDANPGTGQGKLCELCRDQKRRHNQTLVVEKEVDLENIERIRKYEGLYHVLGGVISPLDSSAPARLHVKELFQRIQKLAETQAETEVILATNPTAEGDATALYLERMLEPLEGQFLNLKLSRLGRGLTTGSELEYSDEVTIANALQNRK